MFKSKTAPSKPIALLITSAFKSIVGSWVVVDNQSGDTFLGTYNGGPLQGTVNFTSPKKRTGPPTFADTDIAFIYDENGNATSKIKFRAKIELSADGDTAFFDFECEEVSLSDGTWLIPALPPPRELESRSSRVDRVSQAGDYSGLAGKYP